MAKNLTQLLSFGILCLGFTELNLSAMPEMPDPNGTVCRETLVRLFREYSESNERLLVHGKKYILSAHDERGTLLLKGEFVRIDQNRLYFQKLAAVTAGTENNSRNYGKARTERFKHKEVGIPAENIIHISPAEVIWDPTKTPYRGFEYAIRIPYGIGQAIFNIVVTVWGTLGKIVLEPIVPYRHLGTTRGGIKIVAGFPFRKGPLIERSKLLISETEAFEDFAAAAGFSPNQNVLITLQTSPLMNDGSQVQDMYIPIFGLASVKAKIDIKYDGTLDTENDFPSTSGVFHEIVHTLTKRQFASSQKGSSLYRSAFLEATSDFVPAIFLGDPKMGTRKQIIRDIEIPFNPNAKERLTLSISDPLLAVTNDPHLLSLPISNLFWSLRNFLDPRIHPDRLRKYLEAVNAVITQSTFESRPQFYESILSTTLEFFSNDQSKYEIRQIVQAHALKMGIPF